MNPLRVLLADDHEMIRSGLRTLLDSSPGLLVVGEASDGMRAVALARELHPDVVVMDVSMPGLDGAAATERIVRECPGVKVVALTAHDDRSHLRRLLEVGAAGYVLKRGVAAELVRAIHAVAAGGSYVDPVLAGMLLRRDAATDRPEQPDAASLTDREAEVLRSTAWGKSNKQIAAELEISTKTVETYKARIADKLGPRSRTDIVRYALRRGWLSEG